MCVDATWGHTTRITDNPSAAQNDAPRLNPSEVGSQNTQASIRLLPSQWTVENRGDWDKRGLLTLLSHQCDCCREWLPSPEVLLRHQGSCVKNDTSVPFPSVTRLLLGGRKSMSTGPVPPMSTGPIPRVRGSPMGKQIIGLEAVMCVALPFPLDRPIQSI